jgi:hypothetical protein
LAEAWRKAVKCTWLAERAADEIGRETLKIIRDAWIAIANDGEVVGLTDPKAVLLILDQSKTEKAIPSDPRKL